MSSTTQPRSEPRTRPPRALNVVRDPPPEELGAAVDWSAWYLTEEEDMSESIQQGEIIRLLLSILEQLARERGWEDVYIGGDNFFAWVEAEPLVRISPDVYVLEHPPEVLPRSWQTWQPGHHPPLVALEIVSTDWRKDYWEGPQKYAQLGVQELIIFDPEAAVDPDAHDQRVALQVFVRDADDSFVRTYRGPGPVWSRTLSAYLVTQLMPSDARLRLAHDAEGASLYPSIDEARAQADEARMQAEQEIERLTRELEALRGSPG